MSFAAAPGLPLVGSLPQVAREGLLQAALETWRSHGDYFQVRLGAMTLYFVAHPDGAQHVLKDARHNYVKGAAYDSFRTLTGDGVLTANGEAWRTKRRRVQPAFHAKAVSALVDTMAELCAQTIESLRKAEAVDIGNAFTHLTQQIVGQTLFGVDLSQGAGASTKAFTEALDFSSVRSSGIRLPLWLPTPGNLRMRRALATLDASVYRFIEQARSAPSDPPTMLDMLIAVRDEETDARLDPTQLRDEVMTMYLAGHETTALTLTWAALLLAERPELQDELAQEAQTITGDALPRMADCPKLIKLRAVIEETLRVRGPVWALARNVIADDEIQGHAIPKGATVVPSPYLIHRHRDFWDEPERFDSHRFLNEEPRHEYAYIPFSKGPRMCMGEAFAMAESQVILAMMVRSFRWSRADHEPITPKARVTMRPSRPVQIRLQPR